MKEQLKLLFWIDWFEAKQEFAEVIRHAVESGDPLYEIDMPEGSLEVMSALTGDSRDYIKKQGFYF